MRASRLLSLLMLLQTRGRLSAAALAEELEVSVRTIYRDVDQLSASGVPVVVERGARGGFALLDGWRTRLTGLTAAEAQALLLCGLPGPAAQLGMGGAVASAQLKLLSALPPDWVREARKVSARFHIDPIGWYRAAAPAPWLKPISDAVWQGQRLRLRYQSWKRVVARTVDPLGLVLKAGEWYLVALVGDAPRTYRVAKIQHATPTGERSEARDSFDLAGFWQAFAQRFEADLFSGSATVRATRRGLALLAESSRAVAEAIARGGTRERGGWTRIEIPIEPIERAAAELMRFGRDVEVLAPAALRESLARRAGELAALYRARQNRR